MLSFPNVKINIGLYITNKRSDGYHDLETIFYPIKALHDALEISESKDGTANLHMYGKAVAGDKEQNLIWKAYQLLRARYPNKVAAVDIHLIKYIPMGAGLGGGSADGAFKLKMLNEYFELNIPEEQLISDALCLGSDCPFFIRNTPQYATGRGERMTPVSLDLSDYSIQLICPEVHISTRQAFSMIKPKAAAFDLKEISNRDIKSWKGLIENDFERPVFSAHPELGEIKSQLYAQGAIYASMSGSGSTIYGIFPKGEKATIETSLKYESFYQD